MAIQPRRMHTPIAEDGLDLLQTLIDTPPSPDKAQLQPIALRSTVELRRHALSGYLLRTWVDSLLHHAERVLIVVALLVFGFWLVDGPVRDWLYEQQQPAQPTRSALAPGARQPQQPAQPANAAITRQQPEQLAKARADAIPLPYTTPDMAQPPPEDDFIAPRQGALTAPVALAPEPTQLLIPSIGVDTAVKEVFIVDGAWQVADYAAGYMHGTGLPGEPSNTVLSGHAGLRGGVFRDLGALGPGAEIYLDAAGWRYRYRVRESKSVWPTQTEVLDPTATATLTLITCTNWDTQRLVVVADLIDSKPVPGS